MAKNTKRYTIPGSERRAMPGARAAVPVMPEERVQVSVRVRAKPGQRDADAGGALSDQAPAERRYLSRDEYAARHGASAADIAKVKAFAKAHQLAVVEASAARRTVVLAGTAAAVGNAFGVTLRQFEHDGGTYRGRTGPISVPGDLAGIVEGVFGLDDRPQASPHFQVLGSDDDVVARAAGASFTPPQLASLYDFPTGLDGSGQCIAIIELGGGFKPADISAYFTALKLPVPNGQGDQRRRRPQPSDQREQRRRRGDARHRGRRGDRPQGDDRGLLRTEHRSRLPRRDHDGRARQRQQAVGDLDQLGSGRIAVDAAGDDAVRPGVPGRCDDGRDGVLRRGRQRLGGRCRRRQAARRLSGVEPVRARLRRHPACGIGRHDHRRSGLEREREDERDRRRRERILRTSCLPEIGPCAADRGQQEDRARRPRRRRRCRSEQRLPRSRRRQVAGDRRDERGRAAVGRARRADEPEARQARSATSIRCSTVRSWEAARCATSSAATTAAIRRAKGWDPCTGWGSPVGSRLLAALGAKPGKKPVKKPGAKKSTRSRA